MSTYEPGRLYLIDVDGETHEARYFAAGRTAPGFLTRDGRSLHSDNALNVRLAIVLDPEVVTKQISNAGSELAENRLLADKIRAQITPPEPPMEEPQYVGALVQMPNGDIWARQSDGWWTNLDDPDTLKRRWASLSKCNPRPYENPREKPATGAESDAQGCTGCVPPHVIVNDAEVYDGEDRP